MLFDFLIVDAEKDPIRRGRWKLKRYDVPFVLKLELKFQAFDFDLPLALVFQDGFVRLSMLGRGYIPRAGTILCWFVCPEGRKVAQDIAICSAVISMSV